MYNYKFYKTLIVFSRMKNKQYKRCHHTDIEGWSAGHSFLCDVWSATVGTWYGTGKVPCWGSSCCPRADTWPSGKWRGPWTDHPPSPRSGTPPGYSGAASVTWTGPENTKGNQRKFKRNVLRYKSFLFHNIAGKLSSTQKKLVTQNSIPDNKVFDYVIDVYIPKRHT